MTKAYPVYVKSVLRSFLVIGIVLIIGFGWNFHITRRSAVVTTRWFWSPILEESILKILKIIYRSPHSTFLSEKLTFLEQ